MKSKIEPAQLFWDEQGNPVSSQFDDPYFSRDNGLAESMQVFLQTNDLPNRFSKFADHQNFVIAETGFGTGLNFLLTWRCFKEYAPASATLTYISVEGYPLRPADLQKSLQQWPELQEFSTKLLALYPALVAGHHWRHLDQQIYLHLVFDQIEPALKSLHPKITHHSFDQTLPSVDAWFLDGFAPAKNPDMWQDGIYPSIARLSRAGTTVASFTAAGSVRRALAQWGFEVKKVPGYGRKREMISAKFEADWTPAKEQIRAHSSKESQCWHLSQPNHVFPEEVSILGAGIAGLTLANALAERGVSVQLFDRHPTPLAGASGNPQVAIFGRLSPDNGDLEDFVWQCLAHSAEFYKPFWKNGCGANTGLIQIPRNTNELNKMRNIINNISKDNSLVEYVQASETKSLCGLELPSDALWFPQSGWISPPLFAKQILNNPLIRFTGNVDLKPVQIEGIWHLQDPEGNTAHQCKTLVICSGAETLNNPLFDWLPLKPVAGQISLVPATAASHGLKAILSQYTSIGPALDGIHCLGGTYRLGETGLDSREEDHLKNLANIEKMLGFKLDSMDLSARVAVRATTPDYLPICGPATDVTQLRQVFEPLRRDAKTPLTATAPGITGLFLNVGYGSRGYAYAPLCAEHLAGQICGQSSPLPNHLQRSVHPARFPIREIIRGK